MKFKEREEPQPTDDFWYDLFSGGYLEPEKFLEDELDIKKVKDAIKVLREYQQGLLDNDLIEEM
jgi:hypothetical protein